MQLMLFAWHKLRSKNFFSHLTLWSSWWNIRRSYLRQGWITATYRMLEYAITYPCMRYLLLAPKSSFIGHNIGDEHEYADNKTLSGHQQRCYWLPGIFRVQDNNWYCHTLYYNIAISRSNVNKKFFFRTLSEFHVQTKSNHFRRLVWCF